MKKSKIIISKIVIGLLIVVISLTFISEIKISNLHEALDTIDSRMPIVVNNVEIKAYSYEEGFEKLNEMEEQINDYEEKIITSYKYNFIYWISSLDSSKDLWIIDSRARLDLARSQIALIQAKIEDSNSN